MGKVKYFLHRTKAYKDATQGELFRVENGKSVHVADTLEDRLSFQKELLTQRGTTIEGGFCAIPDGTFSMALYPTSRPSLRPYAPLVGLSDPHLYDTITVGKLSWRGIRLHPVYHHGSTEGCIGVCPVGSVKHGDEPITLLAVNVRGPSGTAVDKVPVYTWCNATSSAKTEFYKKLRDQIASDIKASQGLTLFVSAAKIEIGEFTPQELGAIIASRFYSLTNEVV